MPQIKPIVLSVFLLVYSSLLAQLSFTENKGQWPNQVKYKINSSLHQVYFEKDAFTFNLIDGEDLFASSVHHGHHEVKAKKLDKIAAHAYKMQFVDANPSVKIFPKRAYSTYENFFIGNDKSHWVSNVKSYQEIYYQELYASIDLRIYQQAKGFKYDFIVKAGADPDEIQMHYEGVEKFSLTSGNLKIVTSVGKIIEEKPYVYQIVKGKTKEIDAEYVLRNKILSIHLLEDYNEDFDLIIDPSLIFATYSGSTSDNWGFTACSDQLGNVYSGGIVFNAGYPVTLGAYQYDFAGGEFAMTGYLGSDVTISKYTPDGTTLIWATHLGGTTSEEMPQSLVVNPLNELLILGTTGSSDFPITSGAYDSSFNGGTDVTYDGVIKYSNGTDIFVSKLSADGSQLLGSTYVGGTANDGLNYRPSYASYLMTGNGSLYYNYADGARGEVITDGKSDVFVGTSTFSDDFPTLNSFQLSSNGQQEGVVFKLSSDLTQLIWSSYLGGAADDAIYSIEINTQGETYVAGGTESSNFPTTTGAYETTFQGGTTDAFVAQINTVGSQLMASTYFGSPEYDQAYFVRKDKYNNVFIAGQTEATGSTLIQNAAYNHPNSGQFIAKLFPGLQTLDWSTTFGTGSGKPNISLTAFSVDICNRIYLSGWGREWGGYSGSAWGSTFGTVGMDITSDAEQSVTDGQDFYIMVMFGDASALDYATFFGEQHYGTGYCGHDHVDGGTSRFDRMGNIYQSVCASCGNIGASGGSASCNEFPTTTGAAFEDNGGIVNDDWTCNNAVFRFSFAEDITVADFYADPLVCENLPVHFTNTGIGANYYWDFGDGSPVVNDQSPDHIFPAPGTYDVMLWTIDSNTCNLTDTIIKSITIQAQLTEQLDTFQICLGTDVQIGVPSEANNTYFWTPATGLSSPIISNPMASPSVSTDYLLTRNDNICVDSLFQHVEVIDIQYQMEGIKDTTICENTSVWLSVQASSPIDGYIWSDDPNFINILNPGGNSDIQVSPSVSTDYYILTRDSVCQVERRDTVTVMVDNPQIILSGDDMMCWGDSTNISVQITQGTISNIVWSPSSVILSGQGTSLVTVANNNSFWLVAEVENQNSCQVKDSVFITVDHLQSSFTKTDLLCYNSCIGEIELSYSGINPFSFVWNNGSTSGHLVNLCAGNYSAIITDSLSCSDTVNVEIFQPSELTVQLIDIQDAGCGNLWNSGSATVSVSGGTSPYTYLWSNGDESVIADSLYVGIFTLTVTDANGCQKGFSVQINDPSDLEISMQSMPISCHNICDAAAWTSITVPSSPPYSYLWNNSETTDSIFDLCSGAYTVTVSDANQCVRIRTVSFINPELVNVNVNIGAQACHGDSTSATAIGSGGITPYTYLWSDGQMTETAVELGDGNYSLTVSDNHHCSSEISFSIQSPDPLIVDTNTSPVNCEIACNGTASLSVSGGLEPYSYLWDNGSTNNATDSLCRGKHSVLLTDSNNCSMTIDLTININPDGVPLEATSSPYEVYKGASSQLQATQNDAYSYQWLPDQALSNTQIANPVSTPFSTLIYQVNVRDTFGCKNSDTTIVRVKDVICDEPYIYVPNAFSPNDDGENDILYVRGEMIEDLQFSVYNRWGELVFNTTNINIGWNGVFQDKKVDPAVFVYYLKATCVNKEVFEKKGNITVVK